MLPSIERAASALIALGTDAEVLAPIELRARLAAIAQELARIYGGGHAPSVVDTRGASGDE